MKSGDLVLTKIKGFPEWPTRIVDFSLLPEHIQQLKPKSVSSVSRRGKKHVKKSDDHGELVCVKFYGDDEWIWCSTNDMKPLSYEQIDEYLVKKGEIPDKDGSYVAKKSNKNIRLTAAYKLANNKELSVEDFAKYGSQGKLAEEEPAEPAEPADELEEPEEPEESEESVESDLDKSYKGRSKKRKAKSSTRSSKRAKRSSKSRKSATRKAKSSTKVKPEPKSKPKVKPSEYDDDWGDDIIDTEVGVVDISTIPDGLTLAKEVQETNKLYNELRVEIQTIVLPEKEETMTYRKKFALLGPLIEQVVSYDRPTVSSLRSTNLYRVLTIILKKPEYQKAKFVIKLRKFLKNTLGLQVDVEKHWADDWTKEMDDKEEEELKKKRIEEKVEKERQRREARKSESREVSVVQETK
ncbi:hypothetical protein FOA43_004437 [Brettanomyces nanus]|uniref:PWWP domain-containing protein n=1 Tax=Eeniella nana TaxID=13502 RepID=A0A875RQI1_EENNA|nr:uncharacterized protein FOA43_004437 [Brettanomyces nanus]QPG77040.1 hypothetical protein FOA43_004437 [Brettanomyces nanus]